MRVEYVSPFIEAAINVFSQVAHLKCNRGPLSVKPSIFPTYDVTVIIGVVGDARGQVLYSTHQDAAVRIASLMLRNRSLGELDEMGRSALGELGNMITGNAATLLERKGILINISPPTLIIGRDVRISNPQITTLVVPLETRVGTIEINVGLRED